MTGLARALPLLIVAASIAGCADGVRFTKDDSLRFVAPGEGDAVVTPLRVSWDATDVRRQGQLFGVFVDRSPVAPGRAVESIAEEDPLCERAPACPDAAWLADRGVHVTARTDLVLPALPAGGGRRADDGRRHEITIVLLDRQRRRVGESAWTRVVYAPDGGGA